MEKVLIIDDDRVSRAIIKKAIEKLGFVAIESANGRHGWETLWENDDIKFLITDMAMPDMDGRELIHLIRNDDGMKGLPVIIVSGCFSSEELQPIIAISPSQTLFLPKPLDPKVLQKYVELLLANSESEHNKSMMPN